MAGPGTYNAEHVDQLLQCPVCLDRYNSPKILPCQHTICKTPCLEGLIDRFTRTVRCPQCRAEHFLPRNGVDSFPTNITIAGFLDLQATAGDGSASARNADGTSASGGGPPQCAVCENEAETVKCFHCNKMVCPSCKQSHTGQMKADLGRIINQIRRGLPKLSGRISQAEQKGENMRQTVEAIKAQVRGTVERYANELKEREVLLCSELETLQQGELRSLRLHTENIEVELASISSYCDSMERFLSSSGTPENAAEIPEADLVNIKHQCSEYMQQLRDAEDEELPQLRTAKFDFNGEPLHMSISNFGTVLLMQPRESTNRRTRNPERPENREEPPRSRARWAAPDPGSSVPIRMASSAQTPSASDQPSPRAATTNAYQRPVPRYRPPTPPYQTDPELARGSSRNDMSWIQPSARDQGEPSQSIYLPSRHEDYMFAMSTNTDNIREVLAEIRRQEEWEMNNSIRDRARNRNTQQHLDLFGNGEDRGRRLGGSSGSGYSGPNRRPTERMAGLMGGGGGGGENAVGASFDSGVERMGGAGSRYGGVRPVAGRVATPIDDIDPLLALENEIAPPAPVSSLAAPPATNQGTASTVNQTTSNAPPSVATANQNGGTPSLQPVPNQARPAVRNSEERPLMGGGGGGMGGAGGGASGAASSTPQSNRGGGNTGNRCRGGRGRGRGTCRPPQQNANTRPGNNPRNPPTTQNTNSSGANSSNGAGPSLAPRAVANGTTGASAGASTSATNANQARGGAVPRRVPANASQNPPNAATRSRTFVQEEPSVAETNDLPAVSNNGMSFSINFDDESGGATGGGGPSPRSRRGNTNNNSRNVQRGPSGPRPGDSLTAQNALNHYKRKGPAQVKILGNGKGNNDGQLKWPRGLAISPISDSFIVADSSNHRVQVFDVNGTYVTRFGSYGQQEGEFDCLTGLAVNGVGEIVICDRYNNRIQIFDRYGQFKRAFGSEGREEGQLSYPWGVTCDAAGLIYVCDKENHRIQVFRSDGTYVRKFGRLGNGPGQFENPHYIALTPENKVLVSDSSNHRIQMFTTTGSYIKSFGIKGNGNGQLKFPKGIVVDAQGFIIVADSGNSRIQVFRGNGDYYCQFGAAGSGSGQFRGIEGVALTKDGKVVICDSDNHRIQMF